MFNIWLICFFVFVNSTALALPANFVYLSDVAPDIIQDMRYATSNNFTGRPVPGYAASRCILTRPAALKLKEAQARLKAQGYGLKVFDCYRPQRAVNAFLRWSKNPNDTHTKQAYYPHEDKNHLFQKGYIAEYSGHSRGSTVDLTIIKLEKSLDTTSDLDMGTSFDYFDRSAHVFYKHLTPLQKKNRLLLRQVMISQGFKPYGKEWWHFTLKNEPYPQSYFNFPVQ
ncbi:M15 family metallopeptidase [Legionella impletisoli]|uniref:D-alanyl-D-alanine dipeptidase n=1 Tax=Legionella impletisoli TaxID=343510 RepID=A0A917ND20_9GAMM|nr:M15 family metallopeptidase [Legionella impletisoli]GGI88424.1 D-alanyl-D-alanine dipeptidase [Legionella impletisoli]